VGDMSRIPNLTKLFGELCDSLHMVGFAPGS
jgi:hypothetical protein